MYSSTEVQTSLQMSA